MTLRLLLPTMMAASALIVLGAASPAAADDGGAVVSLDGVTFSAAPNGSLFPDGVVLVPGSRHTGTLWVRNDSDRTADLRISVSDSTASSDTFLEHLSLQAVTARTSGLEAVDLQPGATCQPLLEGELMQPQSVTEVSITLAMRETADDINQGATADTSLMVSLSERGAPSTAADCTPGGGIPLTPDPDEPADGPTPRHSATPAETPATGSGSGSSGGSGGSAGNGGDSDTGASTTDTPVGAAAPPLMGTGSPVLFPWIGVGAAALGAGVFFGLRQRKGHRR